MATSPRATFTHDHSTYYTDNGAPCRCGTTCHAYRVAEVRPWTGYPTAELVIRSECIGCRRTYPRAFAIHLPRHDMEVTAAMLSACHRNTAPAVQS